MNIDIEDNGNAIASVCDCDHNKMDAAAQIVASHHYTHTVTYQNERHISLRVRVRVRTGPPRSENASFGREAYDRVLINFRKQALLKKLIEIINPLLYL